MTLAIGLVLAILLLALVLFVAEWIRMDLVALLVLSALALSGLVSPAEAFSGLSNPAVITVWAMFIMSEGLARTGIAEGIGRHIAHVAGTSEVRMIMLFMLVGGGLSAFMNNIGVAAPSWCPSPSRWRAAAAWRRRGCSCRWPMARCWAAR
ncbi:SLC13 family permease [Alkalilacustris brevis]|uniref:SLC13 family permease n=1 Tax=Alkalilacustris brevis TaxID=2026338 RepID=UPI00192E3775|nr:SLC13 family permease [Alkalilacustris brevis]